MAFLLLRRLIPAVLLAVTATVGGSAIGQPPVACAVPGEWDIGAYDRCMKAVDDTFARGLIDNPSDAIRECCEKTGGVWQAVPSGGGKCVAPPANPARAPSRVPTNTFQPELPPVMQVPGDISQTFAPAPAS